MYTYWKTKGNNRIDVTSQSNRRHFTTIPQIKQGLLLALMIIFSLPSSAQNLAIKNNLLYDATLTPNLGLEFRVAPHATMGVNAGLNAWDMNASKGRKWRHVLVSPYARLWTDSVFHRHFFGAHAVYSHYNVGNVHLPFDIYKPLRHERRQGDLAAIGLSYGYHWVLKNNWHMEAEIGGALGYTKYDKFECGHCGQELGSGSKFLFLPKLALNVGYYFGRRRETTPPVTPVTPVIIPEPDVEPEPVVPEPVVEPEPEPIQSVAEQLRPKSPVLVPFSEYKPYTRDRVLRKDKEALFVNFRLDKSDIDRYFRNNYETLDRIIELTREIMADTLSNVKLIQIIGLASIEGGVPHNEDLASRRARALKQYIQNQLPVPDSLFEVNGGGEAWADLRDQLYDVLDEQSYNQPGEIQRAINIIESEGNLDLRERKLRQVGNGATYRFISRQLLPDQRNSGYLRIYYENVKPESKK